MAITVVWPWPQLIQKSDRVFLAARTPDDTGTIIYNIESDWTVTQWGAVTDLIHGIGGRFHLADFTDYAVAVDGNVLIRKGGTELNGTVYKKSDPYSLIPVMNSICDFNGQLVGGGVKSSWYSCDESFVVWSEIGSESCVPSRTNVAGYMPLKHGKVIKKVKKLGEKIIVYSDLEIAILIPVAEPAPTFALKTLDLNGMRYEGSVGGTDQEHLFVDRDGWLWRLSENLELKKLGYQEFMNDLDASERIVSWDAQAKDYYISDSKRCFLLSSQGMSEVHQRVTGIAIANGDRIAGISDSGNSEFSYFHDTIDMGFRSRKTIFTHELGADSGSQLQATMRYRDKRTDSLKQAPWVEMNDQGFGNQILAGVEFQPGAKAADSSNLHLSYHKFRWKMTDVRSLRGVYAAPPRGQR